MEYLDGKLRAEGVLRKIDTTRELVSFEADKAEWWRKLCGSAMVAGSIRFDVETHYPEAMQMLDLGAEEPE